MRTLESLFFLLICVAVCQASEMLRPRGISLIKASLYSPSKDFYCLDGSGSIPFRYVNDDYCDCRDGSDEPGTAACPNGVFHCSNTGHISIDLRSSRVNDGVCDCCDASDEWASGAACSDVCLEMGRAARKEALRKQDEAKRGYTLKLGMIEQGQNIKQEKENAVVQIQNELESAEAVKVEREAAKKLAEEPEALALQKYREADEAKKEAEKAATTAKNEAEAKGVFDFLDTDNDGQLTKEEIKQDTTYDTNRDGSVSDDEASFYTQQAESLDFATFYSQSWRLMRPAYIFAQKKRQAPAAGGEVKEEAPPLGLFVPPSTPPPLPPPPPAEQLEGVTTEEPKPCNIESGDSDADEPDASDDEHEYEEDEEDYDPEHNETDQADEPAADDVVYDEETQALVDAANAARDSYQDAVTAVKDLERRLAAERDSLQRDYGAQQQFRVLDGACYELSDREYTYRLCPFDKATQTSKTGGGETRLGSWGEWAGEEGSSEGRYSSMKYNNGQSCWNGPTRSTLVELQCGVENQLLSASEPSKCEYVYTFSTPAACQREGGELTEDPQRESDGVKKKEEEEGGDDSDGVGEHEHTEL